MNTTPALMTRLQARNFRAAYDQQARMLTRMTKAALQSELARLDRANGMQRFGGPASKDELISTLLHYDYPLVQLNESIHVLHHGPDGGSSACEWCHPHNGEHCDCAIGRTA